MSQTPAPRPPADAVIRLTHGAEETVHDRLLRRHLPAWVASGAVHVALIVALIFVNNAAGTGPARAADDVITTSVGDTPPEAEKEVNLTNPDDGFDPTTSPALELPREAPVNVEAKVNEAEPVGQSAADALIPKDAFNIAGAPSDSLDVTGLMEAAGQMKVGAGDFGGTADAGFLGRSGATRDARLKSGGGNEKSEAAVARGLLWLVKQQRQNGSWAFDGNPRFAGHTAAATGMALLPFLAAGQTHKPFPGNKYKEVVERGVNFLLAQVGPDGRVAGPPEGFMYAQGIAAIALCEAFGMTADPKMKAKCQAVVNFIVKAQAADGSWGYQPGNRGDTSIVGWQVQALKSAEMCKGLVVSKEALRKARDFLDRVGSGEGGLKYLYGYQTAAQRRPSLTAVGLLCRYYLGWGPANPSLAAGVDHLRKTKLPGKDGLDLYYVYYATQVVHFFGGEVWHKVWNPKVRDTLIDLQVPMAKGKDGGSWDAGIDATSIGKNCGRLGATCMALLTLEVYYRHLPLYQRDTAGLTELDRAK